MLTRGAGVRMRTSVGWWISTWIRGVVTRGGTMVNNSMEAVLFVGPPCCVSYPVFTSNQHLCQSTGTGNVLSTAVFYLFKDHSSWRTADESASFHSEDHFVDQTGDWSLQSWSYCRYHSDYHLLPFSLLVLLSTGRQGGKVVIDDDHLQACTRMSILKGIKRKASEKKF